MESKQYPRVTLNILIHVFHLNFEMLLQFRFSFQDRVHVRWFCFLRYFVVRGSGTKSDRWNGLWWSFNTRARASDRAGRRCVVLTRYYGRRRRRLNGLDGISPIEFPRRNRHVDRPRSANTKIARRVGRFACLHIAPASPTVRSETGSVATFRRPAETKLRKAIGAARRKGKNLFRPEGSRPSPIVAKRSPHLSSYKRPRALENLCSRISWIERAQIHDGNAHPPSLILIRNILPFVGPSLRSTLASIRRVDTLSAKHCFESVNGGGGRILGRKTAYASVN